MKLRAVSLAAIAATASALFAAEPALEFSGVLTADGKTRIALTDRNNNTTTWVEPGETVSGGYVVDRYDPKEEAIFLKKSGQETRLGLVPAKTPDTRAAAPNTAPSVAAARPPPITPPSSTAPAGTAAAPSPLPVAPPIANPPSSSPVASTATPAGAPALPAPATNDPAAVSGTAATSASPPSANDAATTAANADASSTPAAPGANPNPAPVTPPADAYAGTSPATATTAGADTTPTGRPTSRANYVIQGGDTLDGIALTHGVSVQQLRQLNPSLNSNSLRAGETLRIR